MLWIAEESRVFFYKFADDACLKGPLNPTILEWHTAVKLAKKKHFTHVLMPTWEMEGNEEFPVHLTEWMSRHPCSKSGKALQVRPDTVAAAKSKVRHWMVDSGSGHDLVSHSDAKGMSTREIPAPIVFHTANGTTTTKHVVPMEIRALGTEVEPYLLQDTPPVISFGRRCEVDGWAFHWEPYSSNPTWVTPEGREIVLQSERHSIFVR
jgi:hypothetical protein